MSASLSSTPELRSAYVKGIAETQRVAREAILSVVEGVKPGDTERDVFVNTQKFTTVIESIVRKHPEQWVWAHARWKTRPKGEAPLYDFLS